MANYLWKKHRVRIWKERETVCARIRAWWGSKPHPDGDERFRVVCGYVVGLGSPMNYTYCLLERQYSNMMVYGLEKYPETWKKV